MCQDEWPEAEPGDLEPMYEAKPQTLNPKPPTPFFFVASGWLMGN